nr:hypothetical protein [Pedobacter sp. ASV2]
MKNTIYILFLIALFNANANAQLAIGTTAPDASALLELKADNKGFLPPRVSLKSSNDITTIVSPATGLLVYNLGNAGLNTVGYVYWDGIQWRKIEGLIASSPSISSLDCTKSILEAPSYYANSPYNGVLSIPYTGGNGATYAAGTPIPSTGVTGLTATLQAGTLAVGSGNLIFRVTGTPGLGSPNTASFAIPSIFGISGGCTTTVGAGFIGVGQTITAAYSVPYNIAIQNTFNLGEYVAANGLPLLPTVDGIEANLQGNNNEYFEPRIYNRSNSPQLVSWQSFATEVNENYRNINVIMGSNSYQNLDGVCYWKTDRAEVITTNVQIQINEFTHRWYEIKFWCMQVGTANATATKKIFIALLRKA